MGKDPTTLRRFAFRPARVCWYNASMNRKAVLIFLLVFVTIVAYTVVRRWDASPPADALTHDDLSDANNDSAVNDEPSAEVTLNERSRAWAEARAFDEVVRVTGIPKKQLSVVSTIRDADGWFVLIDYGTNQIGDHCSVLVRDDGTAKFHGGL